MAAFRQEFPFRLLLFVIHGILSNGIMTMEGLLNAVECSVTHGKKHLAVLKIKCFKFSMSPFLQYNINKENKKVLCFVSNM